MLKKLRTKFIVINMVIVTVMLCLIFGLLYVSTKRNLERESLQMMNTIAMSPLHIAPPSSQQGNVRLPYFTIRINHTGEVVETGGGFFDLSDRKLLDQIIEQTWASHTDNGILTEYNLRFARIPTPVGQCFVYSDITSEQAILRNLIRNSALIGCAAFFALLYISMLLARWAVTPVESAWKQQKQFVADASHELKTPLTVIMTNAELLLAPECSDFERNQLSENVLTISRQMRGLVESLLELARIDSGSIRETLMPVSFSEIALEAAMMFEPVFFENGMLFSYEISPEINLNGNRAHLKQLTDILLDNAAKYALPGGQTTLSLRKNSSKKCLLTVSNQGEPISDQDLQNLFKRFYRADKARTSRHSYGLGLSIAESITEEHHGKIWAESLNGYNSFYVELPLS